MLTRIFGQINSATNFFIGIYTLLLVGIHYWLHPTIAYSLTTAFGLVYLNKILVWLAISLLLFLITLGAQWLFFTQHKLIKHNAFLPFVLLPLLLLFSPLNALSFFIQVAIFGAVCKTLLDVYQGNTVLRQSLNTGLLLGLGGMFNAQFALLLAVVWVVYIIYGRINFRTFLIPIIGYLSVWFIAICLDFLLFNGTVVLGSFQAHLHIKFGFALLLTWPNAILLAVLFLGSLPDYFKTISHANVFKRQTFSWLFIMLLLALFAFLFLGAADVQLAIVLCVIAVLFVNYLQYIKRTWVREVALAVLLILFGIFEAGLL